MKKKTPKASPRRKPARKAAAPDWMPLPDDAVDDATLLVWVSEEDQRAGPVAELPETLKGMSQLVVEGGRKYELKRVVASGGMGVVYEAVDVHCDRTVAVKVLLSDEKHLEENRRRFTTEGQITSKLEHPNIIPIHELGNDVVGNTYYTMKYVRGLTLGKVLNGLRQGDPDMIRQFPLARLLTIFQKVCDAVAFAHAHDVVHRDLKPGNVMIGDFGEVLVLDWGLARPVKKAVDRLTRVPTLADLEALESYDGEKLDTIRIDTAHTGLKTIKGTVLGTPGYMAPEQVQRQGAVDPRTDIYALGGILHSILTLRSPVRERNLGLLLRRILAGDIPAPANFNKQIAAREILPFPHCPDGLVPASLSGVAVRAMSVAPEQRHGSVTELQQEIEAYQSGQVWHLVIDDDFSKPETLAHWEARGGTAEIVDGELRLHGGELQMLLLKRDMPHDVRIEFEAHEEGNYFNDLGCLLSGVRSENDWEVSISGYAFKYGAYTNTLNVLTRCDRRIWSERASPLAPGRRFQVRAERVGPRLRWMVNNKEVCSVVDPEPLAGANRTQVGLLGWIADTRYGRVRVYTLGTPWKSDVLDMAERHLQKGHYQTAMDLFEEIMNSFPDAERLERSRKGYELARNRNEMVKQLPAWRGKLEKAWPGAAFQMVVDNHGLTVECSNAGIEDLGPLEGLPITVLMCWGNRITSLEPLRGMKLTTLYCTGNPIQSLEPLRGMPLTTLRCERCGITSLEPLSGMPLTLLNCGENNLGPRALEPLRGMPITWLACSGAGVEDLGPLEGMPLTWFFCDANRVSSLEAMRSVPLTEFSCRGNQVQDLAPLKGGKLNTLHCDNNRIKSLEPLRGLPLSTVMIHCNDVESIEPLNGMPLTALWCGRNRLRDVGHFIKNPPKAFLFDCESISTQELEFVHERWSRDFRYAGYLHDVKVLLALRRSDVAGLRQLAAEFQGHRYLFVPRFLAWEEAEQLCRKVGGHLVSITSEEENEFVVSMFPFGGTWFWIGLNVRESGPEWVTGEPFGFDATVNVLQKKVPGPRVLSGKNWCYEIVPNAHNCFVIEWETA